MGKPNVPLLDNVTVFTLPFMADWGDQWLKPAVLLLIVIVVKLLLDAFFATDLGLAMRATGGSPRMARAQGISTDNMTLAGLALSNAMVALAGALYAQSQGGADISMGVGTIVIGLAAVIIGETMIPSRHLFWIALSCVLGAILYRFFIALALNTDSLGLQAQDLNLVTAVLIILALTVPAQRARWKQRSARHSSNNKAVKTGATL
jgi:putative ABC transport system permease protein